MATAPGMHFALAIVLLAAAAAPAAAQDPRAGAEELQGRRRIVHLLSRLTFGPTRDLVADVERRGVEPWLEEQLADPAPDQETRALLAAFPTLELSTGEIYRDWVGAEGEDRDRRRSHADSDLLGALVVRGVRSKAQLAEVMADFWRNHFNVDRGKDSVRYTATEWDRVVIRDHVFGRFGDMLEASAKHPAMLVYLDNSISRRPPTKTELKAVARQVRRRTGSRERGEEAARIAEQRGLNENYARELLELHTLGVDRGYEQKDVIAVAEALTGWTVDTAESRWTFGYRDDMHVHGDKFVLGKTVPRQKKRFGHREGEMILARLAEHPNTAVFLAEKMVRRLVADEPPADLVESTARVLRRTRMDLREALRHVVTSPEFFHPRHERGKFKTPLEFVFSALRVTEAEIEDPEGILRVLREMGQPLYGCEDPTGWSDTAESWRDPGVMAARWSFAIDLARGRVPGVKLPDRVLGEVKGLNRHRVIKDLGERVLPGGLRLETIRFCTRAAQRLDLERRRAEEDGDRRTLARLKKQGSIEAFLLGVLLGSPEFQEQ